LVPPSELETSPSLWLQAVSQYKVRDSFMSYTVLEQCTKELASNMDGLKVCALFHLNGVSPTELSMTDSSENSILNASH